MIKERPSFQFFPNDWLIDAALNQCSLETQGLWIRLMCLMHQSEEYGFLIVGGQILDEKRIRNGINMTPKRFQKAFKELVDFKVIKQDDRGAYYSKRMVEDEKLRQIRAEVGKLGGNPNLLNQKVNQTTNQKPTPSSSSSSSTSIINNKQEQLNQIKKKIEYESNGSNGSDRATQGENS